MLSKLAFASIGDIPPTFVPTHTAATNGPVFQSFATRCQFNFYSHHVELQNTRTSDCPIFRMALKSALSPRIVGDPTSALTINIVDQHQQQTFTQFRKLRYQKIYAGTDLVFYFNQNQLEYDFELAPNANPSNIQLSFPQTKLSIENDRLRVETQNQTIYLRAPFAYQIIHHRVVHVGATFSLDKNQNTVGFKLAHYDKSLPLVIDPVIDWDVALLRGDNAEYIADVALDTNHQLYVLGSTNSLSLAPFNAQSTSPQKMDIFLAKLTYPELQAISITYFSGKEQDIARFLAVDDNGNITIVAETQSDDLAITANGKPYVGDWDIYLARLNSQGNLTQASYWGGVKADFPHAFTTDEKNSLYLGGETWSEDFPTTEHAFLTNCREQSICNNANGFLARWNTLGDLQNDYSTLIGGSGFDAVHGVAFNGANKTIHVVGETSSNDFPTVLPIQRNNHGVYDGFVSLFQLDRQQHQTLIFSSYIGGSGYDSLRAVVAMNNGNTVAGGETDSTDFPSAHTIFQNACASDAKCAKTSDAVIAEIDHHIHENVKHAIIFGGNGNDSIHVLRNTSQGLIAAGQTGSRDFVVTDNALSTQCNQNGNCDDQTQDAFITQWDLSRPYEEQLLYSSYFGGARHDTTSALRNSSEQKLYVVGSTESGNFRNGDAGVDIDGFIARIDALPPSNRYLNRKTKTSPVNGCNLDLMFLLVLLLLLIQRKTNDYGRV